MLSGATVRRAGWLVTAAAAAVAVLTLLVALTLGPSTGRLVVLLVCLVAAFALAGWRAWRARVDRTAVHGARSIASWIAAFSWAATTFTVVVLLAAPGSGPRAALAGVLAGSLFVLAGRLGERATRDRRA